MRYNLFSVVPSIMTIAIITKKDNKVLLSIGSFIPFSQPFPHRSSSWWPCCWLGCWSLHDCCVGKVATFLVALSARTHWRHVNISNGHFRKICMRTKIAGGLCKDDWCVCCLVAGFLQMLFRSAGRDCGRDRSCSEAICSLFTTKERAAGLSI